MSWLWTNTGFFLGFVLFLAGLFLLLFCFGRDRKTGRRLRELWAEEDRPPFAELDRRIGTLLKSGVDGALLDVSFPAHDLTVRFRKDIKAEGDYGIALLLAKRAGTDPHFAGLRAHCEDNGIPFTLDFERAEETTQFLCVDCGRDAAQAFRLLEELAIRIAGIPEHAAHSLDFVGGGRPGELVDRPDQAAVPEEELKRRVFQAFRDELGMSMTKAMFFSLFMPLVSVSVLLGLLYSALIGLSARALLVEPAWSSVTFEFFGLAFSAKVFDLVCLALFLATLAQTATRGYWANKLRRDGADWRPVLEPGWRPDAAALVRVLGPRTKWRSYSLVLLVLWSWLRF